MNVFNFLNAQHNSVATQSLYRNFVFMATNELLLLLLLLLQLIFVESLLQH